MTKRILHAAAQKRWLTAGAGALIALTLALSATASVAQAERHAHARVLPPQSSPHGTTLTESATRWVQWLLSIPVDQSPLIDPDGQFCHTGQSGPVFFLGTNVGGDTVRSCTVPAGKFVLATPGAVICIAFDGETDEELQACAQEGADTLTTVSADVDGVEVADIAQYFVNTPAFSVTLPEGNLFEVAPGDYRAAVSGIFLILPPLSAGEHVVHLHDEFSDGFVSDVTYNLTVAPGR